MTRTDFNIVILLSLFMPASLVSANDFLNQLNGLSGSLDKHIAIPKRDVTASKLSDIDVIAGLKDALSVGSKNVVAQLGKTNGFHTDPAIHIPLPDKLKKVKSALSGIGQSSLMDELELKLNRAAETATPKARNIFAQAIREMRFSDAKQILNGPDDAATQYFKRRMSPPLAAEMRPVVKAALSQAGAIKAYHKALGRYRSLPFVPDIQADLTEHVLALTLKGVFHYLAKEEAAIRKNPVKRTTAILKKVFGS